MPVDIGRELAGEQLADGGEGSSGGAVAIGFLLVVLLLASPAEREEELREVGDELRGEDDHLGREVADDGLKTAEQVFVFEGIEHADVDLEDLAEVGGGCLEGCAVVEEGGESEDGVVADDQVAVVDDLLVDDLHEAADGLVVQLAEGQVEAEQLAGQRVEQWALVQQQRDEELDGQVLELPLQVLVLEDLPADLGEHAHDHLLLALTRALQHARSVLHQPDHLGLAVEAEHVGHDAHEVEHGPAERLAGEVLLAVDVLDRVVLEEGELGGAALAEGEQAVLIEQHLAVPAGEEHPQVLLLDHLVEAVEQRAHDLGVALALPDQVHHVLEEPLAVAAAELSGPPRELLAVLAVVGVEREEFEVDAGCDLLVLEGEGVAGHVEDGLREGDPAVEVVEVAQVGGDLDVEGGVESLEGLVEEVASLLVEVEEDLGDDLLEAREVLADDLVEVLALVGLREVLVGLGDLAEEVDGCDDVGVEVLVEELGDALPGEVDEDHDVHDLLVDLDGGGLRVELVEDLEEVLLEEFLLVEGDGVVVGVVAGEHEVFEGGADEGLHVFVGVGDEQAELADEGGVVAGLHQLPFAVVDAAVAEAPAQDGLQALALELQLSVHTA